jgi:hypothetical protein
MPNTLKQTLSALAAMVLLIWANAAAASGETKYVATTGNDTNPGTLAQPYRTIQKCATTVASGSSCLIRAGTYYETVTPNSGITIAPYNGAAVTIDGSDPVTGWTRYKGSIYRAGASMSSGDTNQVFVGQQMMTEARWPNGNDLFHPVWATAKAGTTGTRLYDSNLPNVNWTGAIVHFWSGSDPWDPQTGIVTSSSNGKLTFKVDGASFQNYIVPMPGGYYYLFGVLAALDAQQEWVYNASSKTLYFWAPGSVNPNTLDVRVKQRAYAFDLSGKSNVTIKGIKLFAATIDSDSSSANNTIDGITATYLSHYTRLFDNPGYPSSYWYDGIYDSGIIINGSGNVLKNSIVSYSAGNGVTLLGTHNLVENNLIHHVDYMATYASGITIQANENTVKYNTVYATARSSISPGYSARSNIDISYNNLFNAMMISRDGGTIYVGQEPVETAMAIHHNWLHDVQSLYSGPGDTYPLAGVYLDDDASGWKVYQNFLWNDEYQSIFLQGQSNTRPNDDYVENNSIIDVNPSSYIWLAQIPDCGMTKVALNFVLVSPVQTQSACHVVGNGASAAGANRMTSSVKVGCNFAGCASDGPPKICGKAVAASIATQPYDMTVTAGQSATFTVTGAGSSPLKYQWRKNGAPIAGATSASYTTHAASRANNGDAFSVSVGNGCGTTKSNVTKLTVQ